ncbi:cell wall / vacuolar inhibitor of fructosidase 1-like [Diospyros lotus]|uniref:cell wall / vacuolar inhibitor of fructosidase 1-like n=1 Tax=Diospyros lotus TaxID=55363 RepID=UPI002254F513|nr:cell wall / vacuolar inhibitor of fructosidase 1-like [Diospyros lotus]
MKAMVSSSLTLALFLVALLAPATIHQCPAAAAAQHDLVTATCKKTPSYQLCLSTLRSDPRSRNADVAGLGIILVDAVKAKATATLGEIKRLKRSKPQLKRPLSKCAELYSAVVEADVPPAIEALTKGDPKFAEEGMVDASSEAELCEKGFNQFNSPLTKVNKLVHDLSMVATAVIRMLL